MKVIGTTNTGTDVQTAQDRSDQELSDALKNAFSTAESDARRFIISTAALATAILDIHEAEVWKRTVDGSTGKLYRSATAYYRSVGDSFPLLHKLLRDELVTELYSANPDAIGVRELAALVHVDPAQVTRSKQRALAESKALAEAKAKAEAEAALSEAVETAAAEAAAEAAANGATEAEAEAAAAAVQRFAQAEAEKVAAQAKAEAHRVEVDAEAKAQAKATKRAISTLMAGLQQASDERVMMTAEDRALTLKLVQGAVVSWAALDRLQAQAEAAAKPGPAKAPAKAAAKPGPKAATA